jgi:uncharacterized membrane protein YjjB (DUF3815 family)
MDLPAIALDSLWAAVLATGLGIIYTAPARYLVATFLCGFIGRGVRDVGVAWTLGEGWATVIAAVAVVLVAVLIVRRRTVSPVVLICGVLPLAAHSSMLNLIQALLQIASLKGEALAGGSIALIGNLGKVMTTSLAIAAGLWAGMAIVRLVTREEAAA